MQYYPDRPAAIRAAQARGWPMFDTVYTPGKGHAPVSTEGPIAEWARVWAEDYMVGQFPRNAGGFVVHVGHRDRKPLIRISCPVSELAPGEMPPEAFIIEPFAESMLTDDVRQTRVSTGGVKPAGTRERTSVTGAVGIVHAICDELHAAGAFDRKVAAARAVAAGIHESTANTQVYRWRKNNGL